MGVCCSCLGRESAEHEPHEAEPLLYDDASERLSQVDYSPHPEDDEAQHIPDPAELKRQDEALARICSDAQDELIDILHQDSYSRDARSGADWPQIINKLLVARDQDEHDDLTNGVHSPSLAQAAQQGDENNEEDEAAWLKAAQADIGTSSNPATMDLSNLIIGLERPPSRGTGSVPRPNRT